MIRITLLILALCFSQFVFAQQPPYVSNNMVLGNLNSQQCANHAQGVLLRSGYHSVNVNQVGAIVGTSHMAAGSLASYKGIIRCFNYEPNKAVVIFIIAGPSLSEVQGLMERMVQNWNN